MRWWPFNKVANVASNEVWNTNEKTLIKHLKDLEGSKFKDFSSQVNKDKVHLQMSEKGFLSKSMMADIIENDYFHIPKNSSKDPDLKLLDGEEFEIKVSHLKMVKGLFRPNFRLVIDALNYQNVIDNPNWKKSDVGKKIKKMIIIFYYKDLLKELIPLDYIITNCILWSPDNYEKEITRDYKLTRDRIIAGQKISERDTKPTQFLINCPKHEGGFCWECFDNTVQIKSSGVFSYKVAKKQLPCSKKGHPRNSTNKSPGPWLSFVNPKSVRKHPILGLAEMRGFSIHEKATTQFFADANSAPIVNKGKSYGVEQKYIDALNNHKYSDRDLH
jgi:hypothetical protein